MDAVVVDRDRRDTAEHRRHLQECGRRADRRPGGHHHQEHHQRGGGQHPELRPERGEHRRVGEQGDDGEWRAAVSQDEDQEE